MALGRDRVIDEDASTLKQNVTRLLVECLTANAGSNGISDTGLDTDYRCPHGERRIDRFGETVGETGVITCEYRWCHDYRHEG